MAVARFDDFDFFDALGFLVEPLSIIARGHYPYLYFSIYHGRLLIGWGSAIPYDSSCNSPWDDDCWF